MRLFFALWPTALAAQAIWQLGRSIQPTTAGRLTRLESIHLTLAFIGEVQRGRVDAVIDAGRRVQAKSFTLMVDRLGYWAHNRLIWVGLSQECPPLAALVRTLHGIVEESGFSLERRPFKAHTTLLRNARGAPTALQVSPIEWPVIEFSLVVAEPAADGTRYRVLERYPLHA
jgi:RNA 2',3'-cyclic 3'-phosphodiesterase